MKPTVQKLPEGRWLVKSGGYEFEGPAEVMAQHLAWTFGELQKAAAETAAIRASLTGWPPDGMDARDEVDMVRELLSELDLLRGQLDQARAERRDLRSRLQCAERQMRRPPRRVTPDAPASPSDSE